MNDSLKEIIKEVIKDFFIITVAMLFVVSLANSIALIEYYPPYFPWVVMGTGAVTSIPTLLFYFKEEPTKLQARIRIVIHFCLIQAIVMTEGFLLGWYKNFPMALFVFAMVTAATLHGQARQNQLMNRSKDLTLTRIIRTNNCILTYKIATYSPLFATQLKLLFF